MTPSARRALRTFERDSRARGLAASTLVRTLSVARSFLDGLEGPLRRVAPDDVRRWLAARVEAGVCATTLSRDLSALRGFVRALVDARLVSSDPTERLSLPRGHNRPPLVLSLDSVRRLLVAAHAPPLRQRLSSATARALRLRDRACLELLYGLGLRASELRLRLVDVNLVERTLLVTRAKRGGRAFLPLPAAAASHLEAYVRDGRPALVRPGVDPQGSLFLGQYGRPIGNDVVTRLVDRAARNAGVRAHPHALRRAVATHLVRQGVPVPCVQELLGHAKLSTTACYVAVDREDLRRAVDVLDRTLGRPQDPLGHARRSTAARCVAVDREDLRRAVDVLDRTLRP